MTGHCEVFVLAVSQGLAPGSVLLEIHVVHLAHVVSSIITWARNVRPGNPCAHEAGFQEREPKAISTRSNIQT